ncbi:hypothetical protein EG68_01321 [Paragonimus skrjabini miyazakii]|uniref:Uncharacterized protein n=1 Tax=Paragonimus skrjabini miyazakii TaxID=59628 RepID=A0A8S9Z8G1_9TREM|nr:hypothetical protein EG68_01321 [Paragonimus skrjabini miyazakii]
MNTSYYMPIAWMSQEAVADKDMLDALKDQVLNVKERIPRYLLAVCLTTGILFICTLLALYLRKRYCISSFGSQLTESGHRKCIIQGFVLDTTVGTGLIHILQTCDILSSHSTNAPHVNLHCYTTTASQGSVFYIG